MQKLMFQQIQKNSQQSNKVWSNSALSEEKKKYSTSKLQPYHVF